MTGTAAATVTHDYYKLKEPMMKRLSKSKKKQLLLALKKYAKRYLSGKYDQADESGTRLMINDFLRNVLGFASLDEIKTEYMIRGTYADYVIQIKGKIHFVVEVKKMPIELSPKHLRQVVNYAANEGIEWALLTNGRVFEFYKIVFSKPIESRKVFSFDLSKKENIKPAADCFQYMHKELLIKRGLEYLWNKTTALDVNNFSRLLYAKPIVNNLRRQLKKAYKNRFSDEEIASAISRVIEDKVENVIPLKHRRHRKKKHTTEADNQTVLAKAEVGIEQPT